MPSLCWTSEILQFSTIEGAADRPVNVHQNGNRPSGSFSHVSSSQALPGATIDLAGEVDVNVRRSKQAVVDANLPGCLSGGLSSRLYGRLARRFAVVSHRQTNPYWLPIRKPRSLLFRSNPAGRTISVKQPTRSGRFFAKRESAFADGRWDCRLPCEHKLRKREKQFYDPGRLSCCSVRSNGWTAKEIDI